MTLWSGNYTLSEHQLSEEPLRCTFSRCMFVLLLNTLKIRLPWLLPSLPCTVLSFLPQGAATAICISLRNKSINTNKLNTTTYQVSYIIEYFDYWKRVGPPTRWNVLSNEIRRLYVGPMAVWDHVRRHSSRWQYSPATERWNTSMNSWQLLVTVRLHHDIDRELCYTSHVFTFLKVDFIFGGVSSHFNRLIYIFLVLISIWKYRFIWRVRGMLNSP